MQLLKILSFFLLHFAQTIEDNVASSERIPDNDSEDLDYELAIEDTDLLFDMDEKEASGSGTTQNAKVVTNGNGKASHNSADSPVHSESMNNSPAQAHQTENENETESTAEGEHEAEIQNDADLQPEEADIENAAIDKELAEGCEEDVADDTLSLDLDADDDLFNDEDDVSKR